MTVSQIKENARIVHTQEDDRIGLLRAAAQGVIEELTGKKLITQTWDFILDAFPAGGGPIILPFGPVQSITSVSYVGAAGDVEQLDAESYVLDADSPYRLPEVRLGYRASWPSARCQPRAVTVRAVLGFGADATAVPKELQLLLRSLASYWFDHPDACEFTQPGAQIVELPNYMDLLLARWTYVGFA